MTLSDRVTRVEDQTVALRADVTELVAAQREQGMTLTNMAHQQEIGQIRLETALGRLNPNGTFETIRKLLADTHALAADNQKRMLEHDEWERQRGARKARIERAVWVVFGAMVSTGILTLAVMVFHVPLGHL